MNDDITNEERERGKVPDSSDKGQEVPETKPPRGQYDECPEQFLTPLEMKGYLRVIEERGAEIPPEIEAHLERCPTCKDNWEQIKETDSDLRKIYQEPVRLMIKSVVSEEEATSSEMPLTPDERQLQVLKMARALAEAGTSSERTWFDKEIAAIAGGSDALAYDRFWRVCREVQQTQDEVERAEKARKLGEACVSYLECQEPESTRKAWAELLNDIHQPKAGSIRWGVAGESSVVLKLTIVATRASTFCSSQGPVLEQRGNEVWFNVALFLQLQGKLKT